MAHPASWRCGLPGDESDYRLGDELLNPGRSFLFCGSADLADHDDRLRFGILIEQPKGIHVSCPDDGVAANTDTGRLSNSQGGELTHSLIRQRARARNDTDLSLQMNVPRHDSDLA